MWITGKQNLDREFEQLLKKFPEAPLNYLENDSYNTKTTIKFDEIEL